MKDSINLKSLYAILVCNIITLVLATVSLVLDIKDAKVKNDSTEITTEVSTDTDAEIATDTDTDVEATPIDVTTEEEVTTIEEITTEIYYEPTTEATVTEVPEGMTYLGTYELTAYCACMSCCGKTDGITASGTQATARRTVGCNSLPLGTVISINGHQYVVEDRGGMSDNVIDIFFDSHEEALNFGRQSADVYLVN